MRLLGELPVDKVSIYFFAGDFMEALRRYDTGVQQVYQTHNEVARLIYDLRDAGYCLTIYSFVTPEYKECRLADGSRVISLGARDYSIREILQKAAANDNADAVVAHFPSIDLLKTTLSMGKKVFPILATSYNKRGLRARFHTWRLVSLLNDARFELVSNHCVPATEQLAQLGVNREKLIAWDIPHPFDPGQREPKILSARRPFEIVYVGSMMEAKGVPELISAIALLREWEVDVHCTLAGGGDIEKMRAIGAELGILKLLSFAGLINNTQVIELMSGADLVVIPSRSGYPEGFPLTMFEAIASRTPIVCSDHSMFRQVMVDGRNASVFDSEDPRNCAEAIRRTLSDPQLYATLSANAGRTWDALKGPADWRTMILKWLAEGPTSPWIRGRMLSSPRPKDSEPE
jgi:glycosyltransferase involved in cell wall biosynthesis